MMATVAGDTVSDQGGGGGGGGGGDEWIWGVRGASCLEGRQQQPSSTRTAGTTASCCLPLGHSTSSSSTSKQLRSIESSSERGGARCGVERCDQRGHRGLLPAGIIITTLLLLLLLLLLMMSGEEEGGTGVGETPLPSASTDTGSSAPSPGSPRSHALLWPGNRIPVLVLPEGFSSRDLHHIRGAMAHLTASTNLQVHELTPGEEAGQHYVTVRRGVAGLGVPCECLSPRGRQPFLDWQVIDLGPGCADNRAMVMHELLHTAGLGHVHQRPDRDLHVRLTVPLDRLPAALARYPATDPHWPPHGYPKHIPYDTRSIMHYSSYAFTRLAACRHPDGGVGGAEEEVQPVMVGVDGSLIGHNHNLTDTDVRMINELYPLPPTRAVRVTGHEREHYPDPMTWPCE